MKETEYKLIQVEDQCENVIGQITMHKDDFCTAELFSDYICSINDLQEARNFLDVVETKMKESKNMKFIFE